MKQSLMPGSHWPGSIMSIMRDICLKSVVRGVIIIPWSAWRKCKSPPEGR